MKTRTISCLAVLSAVFFLTHAGNAQQPSPLPENYVQVNAPLAQRITIATKQKHPEIAKLGLHATPLSSSENVIIACDVTAKIGKKSSAPDMKKVLVRKPTAEPITEQGIYDLFLPLKDAKGRDIGDGFVVMEVPFKNAADPQQALTIGEKIRNEIEKQIPSRDALYR